MKLKDSLSYHLKLKGWTLSKLARESGISKSTLHSWVVGRGAVNLEKLKIVAQTLQVSVHQLAFGEPDPFEQAGGEILKEIFTGDVRVTLHRIERSPPKKVKY